MKKKIWGFVVVGSVITALGILASPARSNADDGGSSETSSSQVQQKESARKQFQLGMVTGPSFDAGAGGGGPGMSIGARMEYKPTPLIGLGVFGMYTGYVSQDFLFATGSESATVAGFETRLYPFSNDGLYLGGKIGMTTLSETVTFMGESASQSETDLMLGADLGYNFKLSPSFSIGPELAYFSTATSAGQDQNFTGLLTLNYWF